MNSQEFMDVLNILSFGIGLQNLDSNLDQTKLEQSLGSVVEDIHKHLKLQDEKLDMILSRLEEIENDKD